MGILDGDINDQGLLGLYLMAAGAAKPQRTSFGEGLLGGIQMVQQRRMQQEDREAQKAEREQRRRMQDLQMQQLTEAAAEQQRQRARASTDEGLLRQTFSPMPGPTQDGGPLMPRFDPRTLIGQGASLPAVVQAMQLNQAMQPPKPQTTKLSPGEAVFDDKGRQLFGLPKAEEARPTELARLLSEMQSMPQGDPRRMLYEQQLRKMTTHSPAVNVSYGAPVAGVDAKGNPVFFQPGKTGGPPAIVPGVTPPRQDKPLTEAQAKAAAFGSQMASAERELARVAADGSSMLTQLDVKMASGMTNPVASNAAQQLRQAQEQWAEAYLRFKTGAASTEEEVKRNVRTYFPQPGDGPSVVAQKERMRKQAQRDVGLAAGSRSAAEGQIRFLGFENP